MGRREAPGLRRGQEPRSRREKSRPGWHRAGRAHGLRAWEAGSEPDTVQEPQVPDTEWPPAPHLLGAHGSPGAPGSWGLAHPSLVPQPLVPVSPSPGSFLVSPSLPSPILILRVAGTGLSEEEQCGQGPCPSGERSLQGARQGLPRGRAVCRGLGEGVPRAGMRAGTRRRGEPGSGQRG